MGAGRRGSGALLGLPSAEEEAPARTSRAARGGGGGAAGGGDGAPSAPGARRGGAFTAGSSSGGSSPRTKADAEAAAETWRRRGGEGRRVGRGVAANGAWRAEDVAGPPRAVKEGEGSIFYAAPVSASVASAQVRVSRGAEEREREAAGRLVANKRMESGRAPLSTSASSPLAQRRPPALAAGHDPVRGSDRIHWDVIRAARHPIHALRPEGERH